MGKEMSNYTVFLKKDTREVLQRAADEKRWPLSEMIRDILDRWVEKQASRSRKESS